MARNDRRWAGSRSTPRIVPRAGRACKRSITHPYRSSVGAIDRAPPVEQPHGMPDRLLLPVFVLLWSSGYVVGALAIQVADPLPLLAVRFTLAALVLAPFALRRWRG